MWSSYLCGGEKKIMIIDNSIVLVYTVTTNSFSDFFFNLLFLYIEELIFIWVPLQQQGKIVKMPTTVVIVCA